MFYSRGSEMAVNSDQWPEKTFRPTVSLATSHYPPTESMKAFRNLRTIGALLLLVMAIGTAGYHYIEGWPWFDGFYMVVTTLTTIGYQEVHPLSHAGRVFNVFVILAGVSLLLLGVGALSQALLEFELQSFFGRRRMEREIGRLDSHFIICGMGRVGRSVARELARKPVPFVILEKVERSGSVSLPRIGWCWLGDATQEQTLRAGKNRTRLAA